MFCLITGGSASGKSAYAETRALALSDEMPALSQERSLYYVATMQPYGREGDARIARHHGLRRGKGFYTVERYLHIGELQFPKHAVVLVECLTNLLANESYEEDGMRARGMDVVDGIVGELLALRKCCKHLIVVTGEVFGDEGDYTDSVKQYIQDLGSLHQRLAGEADEVVEVVYSIPVKIKGA